MKRTGVFRNKASQNEMVQHFLSTGEKTANLEFYIQKGKKIPKMETKIDLLGHIKAG